MFAPKCVNGWIILILSTSIEELLHIWWKRIRSKALFSTKAGIEQCQNNTANMLLYCTGYFLQPDIISLLFWCVCYNLLPLQLVIHPISMLSRTDSTFTYFLRDNVSVMADESIAVLWTANLLCSVSKKTKQNKTKQNKTKTKTKNKTNKTKNKTKNKNKNKWHMLDNDINLTCKAILEVKVYSCKWIIIQCGDIMSFSAQRESLARQWPTLCKKKMTTKIQWSCSH